MQVVQCQLAILLPFKSAGLTATAIRRGNWMLMWCGWGPSLLDTLQEISGRTFPPAMMREH